MEETKRTVENGHSPNTPFGDPNEVFDELEKTAASWAQAASETIRKYPLQSVAVGLALGALAGILLKSGRSSGK